MTIHPAANRGGMVVTITAAEIQPQDFYELAAAIARRTASEGSYLDGDDVYQEIILNMLDEWAQLKPRIEQAEDPVVYARKCLQRSANSYAMKMRQTYERERGVALYGFEATKTMLSSWFEYENWVPSTLAINSDGFTVDVSDAATSGDRLADMAGVSVAWKHLPTNYRAVLFEVYSDRPPASASEWVQVAANLHTTEAAVRRMHTRAIHRLTAILNAGCDGGCEACIGRAEMVVRAPNSLRWS
jgi:hypothetical protein